MTTPVIAFIGAGNMGSSLIGGLIKNGHPANAIWASDPSKDKLQQLADHFAIHTTDDNKHAVQAADVVIFAVKPQLFGKIAQPLKDLIQAKKPLIISIAAGVREASIEHCLGSQTAIVRTMPNTPALIGCGAAALHANQHVSAHQRSLAESILRAVGITVWLQDESQMDIVTALSGSGPAYFFMFMEGLQEAAEQLGLPADVARMLTLETALGAAKMAIESDHSLAQLRHQVTSPGGTTEKGLEVLEKHQIKTTLKSMLQAAKLRSEELATLLGETT